jgi:hypothetical protein
MEDRMTTKPALSLFAAAGLLALGAAAAQAQDNPMSFFVTSVGPGNGADLGGLEGADAHCPALAEAAGAGGKTWRAYLSTSGDGAVNALDENGNMVKGRGDEPNQHDILTGSQRDGTAFPAGEDMTCSNWTSSGEGSAMVGHHDLIGNPQGINFWNFSHPSRGCSQENLVDTGGAGLFYCFAAD